MGEFCYQKQSMLYFLFALFLLALAAPTASFAAIYGSDNRQDISAWVALRPMAKAVGVAVGKNLLVPNSDGTLRLEIVDQMRDWLCRDERFSDQTSLGFCTGFLISDRLLLTAGHCGLPTGSSSNPQHPLCTDIAWILDYNMFSDAQNNPSRISKEMVFGCKRLVRAETMEKDSQGNSGADFAILELDRPVPKSIRPFTLSKSTAAVGASVFALGHPSGMPLKHSGISRVMGTKAKSYFEVNLDTQSGNSGGPVLNSKNEVVGILVSGHSVDYVEDFNMKCQRPNRCNSSGNACTEGPPKGITQTSNQVQKINSLRAWLPAHLLTNNERAPAIQISIPSPY